MNYWTLSKDNIYVAAHRGWSTVYPENTLLAFRKAIEIGVDQIETDVRITRDGELVCIHDATVDRTTNGTGKVCDKNLAELTTPVPGRARSSRAKRSLLSLNLWSLSRIIPQ